MEALIKKKATDHLLVEKQKKAKKSMALKNEISALLFLLPSLVLFALFKYYPILSGIFVSFFQIDIVNLPGEFIGLDNYIRAFTDTRFYSAMWHNVKLLFYSLVMNYWCPIVLAIMINEIRRKKQTFFRLIYFIPAVAPAIAMTILWKYFWQPDYGLANYIIGLFGLPPQMWLNSESWVYFCISFPGLIICGGLNMVIYLAALQDVPNELYESALIDGAGFCRRVWNITLPLIGNVMKALLLLSVIGVFGAMENVMIYTGGGPGGATETMLLYAYKQATTSMDYSYAITMATIVFFLTLIITIIINQVKGKRAEGER